MADITALAYPAGRLEVDHDDDRVRCHVCGGWWKHLATHARYSHGLLAEEYRRLAGLHPRRALVAPSISERHARTMRARRATDPRIRDGMARGAALAASGALQARARETAQQRGPRLAREQQLRDSGRALGGSRAAAYTAKCQARARELGHASLEAYLRARYIHAGATIEEIQRELGAGYEAVRAELRRWGITVSQRRRARREADPKRPS